MTRQLDDLKPAEIKTAILEVFPDDGNAQAHHLLDVVAVKLGSSRFAVPEGRAGREADRLYIGRVERALDKLAEESALVRVGTKDRQPDGTSPGGVHYWTPAGFAAAAAGFEKRQAENIMAQVRWDRVAERLGAVNVGLRKDGSLSLDDWEHLLESVDL